MTALYTCGRCGCQLPGPGLTCAACVRKVLTHGVPGPAVGPSTIQVPATRSNIMQQMMTASGFATAPPVVRADRDTLIEFLTDMLMGVVNDDLRIARITRERDVEMNIHSMEPETFYEVTVRYQWKEQP